MAIDPDWVRENPEEAARQMDVLGKKYDALMSAKLEALPADLKNRYVIVKMTGDIDRETVREFGKALRKYTAGNAVFINMPVDIEAIDVTNRDAIQKAAKERDVLAAHLEVARQIATDWVENEQTTAATWQLARQIGKWALKDTAASLAEGGISE